MKRILLACSLFIASSAAVFAQSAPTHPTPTPVSKTEFTTKVNELDALIAANNLTAAEVKYHEISELVNSEMLVVKYKMQDAMDAHNDVEKAHYFELAKTQRGLNAAVMQLKDNMTANKALINEKLNAFAASII